MNRPRMSPRAARRGPFRGAAGFVIAVVGAALVLAGGTTSPAVVAQVVATPTAPPAPPRPADGEPVVPAATRSAVPVPPRPGQPTWTPSPTATSAVTPTQPATATPVATQAEAATPTATATATATATVTVASTPTLTAYLTAPAAGLTTVPARFGYGVNVFVPDAARMQRVRELGVEWLKVQLAWADAEPEPGRYAWDISPGSAADVYAVAAESAGAKLVLRVDRPPGWANGDRGPHAPPDDPATYARFLRALSEHLRGRVAAYELWNEPNLAWEWGDRDPDPAAFTRLLNAGYDAVKAGDPAAVVVSGALVATGWTKAGIALDDLEFLRGMARNGARFDALGVHPYGYAAAPDGFHENGILQFRRAESWRAVMEEVGWRDRPMWATEFNWLVDPNAEGASCDWPDRDWQRVTPERQADYLVQAFAIARERWPWMGPMFVFNLDMAMVPATWTPPCEQMRWYSLLRPDGSPRPAFNALRDLPKRGR